MPKLDRKKKVRDADDDEDQGRKESMESRWQKAREEPDRCPQGTYIMRLANAEKTESQSSGKEQIHREWVILEGSQEGVSVHDYMQLETDRGPFHVRRWLEGMGFDVPETYAELDDVLASMVEAGPIIRGKVLHRGDFDNVRLIKLLEQESETEDDGEPDDGDEEDGSDEKTSSEEGDGEEEGEEEGEESGEEDDETKKGILELLSSFGVEADEDSTTADLVSSLTDYDWDPDDLDEEQQKFLHEIEEEYNIELLPKPEPKKKVTKKAPAKKKK